MGCGNSKDAVKAIQIEDGEVKGGKSVKKVKVVSSDETLVSDTNAAHVGVNKSTSAKSRDSGIQEMDYSRDDYPNGIITEESDPHLVQDIEDFELVGRQFHSKSAGRERMKSKAILEALEAEGLISGTKVQKGGAAFEVRMESLRPLEPLAPIKRAPPRLQRLKSEKKILSKEELEEKQRLAECRRNNKLSKKKSRLASQIAQDQELAQKLTMEGDNAFDSTEDEGLENTYKPNKYVNRGQGENIDTIHSHTLHKNTVFDEGSMSSLEDGLGDSIRQSQYSSEDFFESKPGYQLSQADA
ncbi:unnamed protein product [Clavelina lepadiformis]|uniref:Stathmin domain-containing protein 1 n=1 Tax=Clavelina lepadiformis TaxID=159417 RepID=A0ABP0H1S3_CLALP